MSSPRYSAELAARPQIIVANKADLPDAAPSRERVEQHCAANGLPLFVISAVTGSGLAELVRGIAARLQALSAADAGSPASAPTSSGHRPERAPDESARAGSDASAASS